MSGKSKKNLSYLNKIKELKQKSKCILKSNDDIKHLKEIVTHLEYFTKKQLPVSQCLQILENTFTTLMERDRTKNEPHKFSDKTLTDANKEILQNTFIETVKFAQNALDTESIADNCQALATLTAFLKFDHAKSFENRLRIILSKLLSTTKSNKQLIGLLKENGTTAHVDVIYYAWKAMPKLTLKPAQATDLYVQNYFDLVAAMPINTKAFNESPSLLCNSSSSSSNAADSTIDFTTTLPYETIKKALNKCWQTATGWHLSAANHKQMLMLLITVVLPHLHNPILMTDFFMDSLEIGGQMSVLALQGVFVLCQQSNIAYPNIYEKLYSLFTPEIFHANYKARLFYLADIFLSSTHLPKTIIAAFAKRLARLSLAAPPQDIAVIIYFVENLLMRHPEVKRLLMAESVAPNGADTYHDPYAMMECDPNRSQALQSSLWEIVCHKRHAVTSVDQLSSDLIWCRLPNVEWDLGEYLDVTDDDIFDQEVAKESKCGLNFEHNIDLSKNGHWMHWDL